MTSYILDRSCFTLLCVLVGGNRDNISIPKAFYEDITEESYNYAIKKLSDIGYIHVTGERIDMERTIHFLISKIISTPEENAERIGRSYVFRCDNIIIVMENDRLSAKKCRIVPIKDEEMLNEYFSENEEG